MKISQFNFDNTVRRLCVPNVVKDRNRALSWNYSFRLLLQQLDVGFCRNKNKQTNVVMWPWRLLRYHQIPEILKLFNFSFSLLLTCLRTFLLSWSCSKNELHILKKIITTYPLRNFFHWKWNDSTSTTLSELNCLNSQ